jgi:hypothetical protein
MSDLFSDIFSQEKFSTSPSESFSYEAFDDGLASYNEMLAATAGYQQLTTSLESLANIHDVAFCTLRTGGLNSNEAITMQYAIDAGTATEMKTALGKPLYEIAVPSVESFGDSPNYSKTAYSCEKMREVIAKGWNAIRKFLMKWWNAAVDFFYKYLGATVRLEKSARALAAKAADSKKSGTTESTITIGGAMNKDLTPDLVPLAPATIKKDLLLFTQVVEGFKDATGGMTDILTKAIATYDVVKLKQIFSKDQNSTDAGAILANMTIQTTATDVKGVVLEGCPKLATAFGNAVDAGPDDERIRFIGVFNNKKVFGSAGLQKNEIVIDFTPNGILGNKHIYAKIEGQTLKEGAVEQYTRSVNLGSDWVKEEDIVKKHHHEKDHKVTPLKTTREVEDMATIVADLAKALSESRIDMRKIKHEVDVALKDLDKLNKEITEWSEEEYKKPEGGVVPTFGENKGSLEDGIPASAGTPRNALIKLIKGFISKSFLSATICAEPYNSLMQLAGASARATYEYANMSFNNLKDA